MPQAPASLRPRFNLKREAAPVATRRRDPLQLVYGLVSISNEKPPRLPQQCNVSALRLRFVSISNEKPPRLPPAAASRHFWSGGIAAFARQMGFSPLKYKITILSIKSI